MADGYQPEVDTARPTLERRADDSLYDVMASQLGWDVDATQFGDYAPSEAQLAAEPPAATDKSQGHGSGRRPTTGSLAEAFAAVLGGAEVGRGWR